MYRVGLPGWKLAAKAGFPLKFRVQMYRDEASNSYWASSSDLDGLVVSGKTLDELRQEIVSASSVLVDLALNGNNHGKVIADLHFQDAVPCGA